MKPNITSESAADAASVAALLSALVDGETDPAGAGRGCQHWRHDPQARTTWHAYQMIGDVLRSDELATPGARDEAFLSALRARMKDEPVLVAPAPAVAAPVARERRWVAGAAVAAGFVALAGVAVVSRTSQPEAGPGLALVAAPSTAEVQRVGVLTAASAPAQALVVDGKVIRDARLDAYFDAHRGAFVALPSAVPGGGLRSVDVIIPQR